MNSKTDREKIRIGLAEFMGWRDIRDDFPTKGIHGWPPDKDGIDDWRPIPDPGTNLDDAMAAVEKIIKGKKQVYFRIEWGNNHWLVILTWEWGHTSKTDHKLTAAITDAAWEYVKEVK